MNELKLSASAIKTPAISNKLYCAMWNKLSPSDFDKDNPVDKKLLEYLGWDENE